MLPTVLVLDDEPLIHRYIERTARRSGWTSLHAIDNRAAWAAIAHGRPDVILQDVNRPFEGGYELLTALRVKRLPIPVVMMSGWYSQGAALRLGAVDTLEKPSHWDETAAALGRAASYGCKLRALDIRPIENADAPTPAELVGFDGALLEVKLALARIAATDAPLLLRAPGERCAERVARVAHALSARAAGPMVVVAAAEHAATTRARLFGDPILGPGAVARARRGTLVLREPQKLAGPEIEELLDALARQDAPRLIAIDEALLGEARLFGAVGGDVLCIPAFAARSARDQRLGILRLAAECSDERGHFEREAAPAATCAPDASFIERRRALAAAPSGPFVPPSL